MRIASRQLLAVAMVLACARIAWTLQKRKSKSSPSSQRPRRKRGSTNRVRQGRKAPREVALAEVKDDLSKYLRQAAEEESSSPGMADRRASS
jgi:hypothetical protein